MTERPKSRLPFIFYVYKNELTQISTPPSTTSNLKVWAPHSAGWVIHPRVNPQFINKVFASEDQAIFAHENTVADSMGSVKPLSEPTPTHKPSSLSPEDFELKELRYYLKQTKTDKVAVIYHNGPYKLLFLECPHDFKRFNNVYQNDIPGNISKKAKIHLMHLQWDMVDCFYNDFGHIHSHFLVPTLGAFQNLIRSGATLIQCGWIDTQ